MWWLWREILQKDILQTLNKNEQVDPEVESLEPDVEPEVIVDKIVLMHEITNDLIDIYIYKGNLVKSSGS